MRRSMVLPVCSCQARRRSGRARIGVRVCTPSSKSHWRRTKLSTIGDLMALLREIQRRRPTAVAVSTQHSNLHVLLRPSRKTADVNFYSDSAIQGKPQYRSMRTAKARRSAIEAIGKTDGFSASGGSRRPAARCGASSAAAAPGNRAPRTQAYPAIRSRCAPAVRPASRRP